MSEQQSGSGDGGKYHRDYNSQNCRTSRASQGQQRYRENHGRSGEEKDELPVRPDSVDALTDQPENGADGHGRARTTGDESPIPHNRRPTAGTMMRSSSISRANWSG